MKKVIHSELFDSLVKSDFLILKKKGLHSQDKVSFSKNNQFFNLNSVTLLKTLKQFIRLIQFVKKDGAVNLDFKNRQLNSVLTSFLKKNNLNIQFKNQGLSFKGTKTTSNELLLFLDGIRYSEKHLFKKLITEKRFLVQNIDSVNVYNNLNMYRIYNDLNDMKKLLFLLCLIQQTTK
jgi:hypothetical protein